ncbi:MAG: glycosyltransferase [Planctomycetes bacterium]|nr:glycosyltransferase [Planctomycetota bacterium]
METSVAVASRDAAPVRRGVGLTVLVPAYNEEASVADTVRSLLAQSVPVDEILVIDDCSTDRTGDVARGLGATVLRPHANTGSKAGAQTFALAHVRTPYVMAIDADTVLDPHAVERILPALREPGVAAACGFVLPRRVRTLWERGRYVEYLFAFTFYKPIQDHYARPLISSGCFSVYRTEVVRACGGWSNRTMAEDMDLTWTLYHEGHGVRFVPEAVSYPLEPHNFHFLSKQLRRWSHGFVQNVRLHWRQILHQPLLRSMVAVGLWDAAIASVAFLVAVPLLSVFVSPLFLLAYLFDLPAVLVPTLVGAWRRKEVGLALASIPGFFVLRLVNGVFMLRALWSELVLRRTLKVYEKGH